MLNQLERRFGQFVVPHLTLVLTIGLAVTVAMRLLWPGSVSLLVFDRYLILQGELWRLVSFLIVAPGWHPVFAAFGLYLFYLMGNALENEWGEFQFNLFVGVGWLATLVAAWLVQYGYASNAFLLGSVFLAFAWRYPDFTIYLFFLLPVKIKWLALLTWLGYGWSLITGSWTIRALVLAAVANFLLFFWREILLSARSARRRMEHQAGAIAHANVTLHRCTVCGATETSHPDLEFRVCTDCQGEHEYCQEHLENHRHV
ncbi:hypothetical protein HQ590_10505 [bacterium]|nr:hypothetical protein [bacterium]